MLDLLFYFEQTGVGLPRNEIVLLNLSIRKFASTMPLENIRYFNLYNLSYIIVCLFNKYIFLLLIGILDFGVKYLGNLKIIIYWKLNFRRMSLLEDK